MKNGIILLLLSFLYISSIEKCNSQEDGFGTEFHSFVTKFSQKNETQLQSIVFPLPIITDNDKKLIEKKDWKLIDYCFGCEFSPILFMGKSITFQAGYYNIVNDTDYIISVYLMPEKKIQNYHFKKLKDKFELIELHLNNIPFDNSESFFDFIDKFSIDTNFVRQRLSENIKNITWKKTPDNLIEVPIKIKDFVHQEYLFKRIYLDNIDLKSNDVSLFIKGEGTGYHLEYYFKRTNKKWYLIKSVNKGV